MIFILVIITTWSFGMPYPPPAYQIVSSPQEAALRVYNNEKSKFGVEPDQTLAW